MLPAEIFFSASFSLPKKKLPWPALVFEGQLKTRNAPGTSSEPSDPGVSRSETDHPRSRKAPLIENFDSADAQVARFPGLVQGAEGSSPWFHWHASSWSWPGNQAGLPLPELQASLMLLASDALSKFDGSTAPASPPPAQQPSAPLAHQPETHPTPPAAQAPETASPVVPPEPAAAVVVAQSRGLETPTDSTDKEQEEEAQKEGPLATTNLNSAKAEAKLVMALDYLVAINDNSDNPAQKWVINESILASLTGCFRPAIKKFFETHRSFIN